MPVTVAGVVSGEFHEDCFSFVILVRVNLKQQKGLGKGGGGEEFWNVFVFFFCGFSSTAEAVVECVAFRKRSCSRVGSSSESEYLTRSWRERDLLLEKMQPSVCGKITWS